MKSTIASRSSRALVAVLLFLVASSTAVAKPKEQTFDAPRDRVFAALTKVIETHHVLTVADEKNFVISFHTGMSVTSYGMNCTASLEPDGSKTKVIINTQKTEKQMFAYGAGDRIANNIFKWISDELAKPAMEDSKPN